MTPTEGMANILLAAANFILLWVLAGCWRSYRIDALRHRFFVLRDELFDYAMEGNLSFQNPAYAILRRRVDNLLRFAHKIAFTRVLLFLFFRGKAMDAETAAAREREWVSALEQLPGAQRKRIEEIHERVLSDILKHMALGIFALLLGKYFLWIPIRALLLDKARIVEIEAERTQHESHLPLTV